MTAIRKKLLYLDSDIVAKAGLFMKLVLNGDNTISLSELMSFNKKWAYAISKELGYDDYHTAPKDNMIIALERLSYYDKITKRFILNPLALKNILASFENYKNEFSANKMYISVYENLLERMAGDVKPKNAELVLYKLNTFVSENFVNENPNKYATSFSNHEIVGKILIMHAELLFEKKIGLNYEFTLPKEEEIRDNFTRLQIQERTFVRMIEDDNLSPQELELIAKVIREKKFNLSRQMFLIKRLKPQQSTPEEPNIYKTEKTEPIKESKEEYEIDLDTVFGDFEVQTEDAVSSAVNSVDEVLASAQKTLKTQVGDKIDNDN